MDFESESGSSSGSSTTTSPAAEYAEKMRMEASAVDRVSAPLGKRLMMPDTINTVVNELSGVIRGALETNYASSQSGSERLLRATAYAAIAIPLSVINDTYEISKTVLPKAIKGLQRIAQATLGVASETVQKMRQNQSPPVPVPI